MQSNRSGYRGYIASRPIRGDRTPQNVQNLVIRDYAQRNKLTYLLSATEFSPAGCHIVLEDVLQELSAIEGLICYSLFMLPQERTARLRVYDRVLASGGELHAALENLKLADENDVARIEDIWMVDRLLPDCLPPKALG
jgi:sporadic carbohydrate cluster protein (TIGR04323 family)